MELSNFGIIISFNTVIQWEENIMFRDSISIFSYIFDLYSKKFESKEEKSVTGLRVDIEQTYKIKENKDSARELIINWGGLSSHVGYRIIEKVGSDEGTYLYGNTFNESMDKTSETYSNQKLFLSVVESLKNYISKYGDEKSTHRFHHLYNFIKTVTEIRETCRLDHVMFKIGDESHDDKLVAVLRSSVNNWGIKIGISSTTVTYDNDTTTCSYSLTKLTPVLSIHENKSVEWIIPEEWHLNVTTSPDELIKLIKMFHK